MANVAYGNYIHNWNLRLTIVILLRHLNPY